MSQDPFDKPTSASVEFTPAGFKVNAKSRAIAAFDRLLGNAADFVNIPIERRNVEERSKMEASRMLVEAIRDHALSRLKTDPEFADRVSRSFLESLIRRQENKDGVVRHAIEELRRDPQAEEPGEILAPLFIDKLERLAEDATTEQLREKWGRVLAAEIRKPGTFSPKVLRVLDELDSDVAAKFEELCCSRLENMLPTCLVGELDIPLVARLVEAGLLVDPDLGRLFEPSQADTGLDVWFLPLENFGIVMSQEAGNATPATSGVIQTQALGMRPGMLSYMLTITGLAVSSILPDHTAEAFARLSIKIREAVGQDAIAELRRTNDGPYEDWAKSAQT